MIRIATYNIHKCVGTDRRRDPGRIIEVLAEIDADIVALQEADLRFGDREGLLDLDQLQSRARAGTRAHCRCWQEPRLAWQCGAGARSDCA